MNTDVASDMKKLQIQPDYASRSLWEALALQEDLHYEVLELSMLHAQKGLPADDAPDGPGGTEPEGAPAFLFNQCTRWYRKSGRVSSLHGAFIDINPASGDLMLRALSRQRCHESCRLAEHLGAGQIVFHSSCETFLRGAYMDAWAGLCGEFYDELADQYDLQFWIENSRDTDAAPLQELMKRIHSPKIGVCLDLGHVNYSRMPMEGWFDALGDHIGYLHLSDNGGLFDDHLALGDGTVDWAAADADCLIDMLNHYLEAMTDAIQNRGGTIIEFIGDGIMAIFGAPHPSDNHAADAVAAALEMQKVMTEVNNWNKQRNYPYLEMGIGLNCGPVIVGNIGSVKRMKYGVVGSHVNLCGRIESYTAGGQILISPRVREQVRSPLLIEKEITVLPKGVNTETVLSQVTGIGAPYDIQVRPDENVPEKLKEPVPVCFYRIDEKHTGDQTCYGGIVGVGNDCALLETETALALYDNLQIEAGGRLLCKVMEKNEQTYLVRYTSIPSGYKRWVRTFLRE